MTEQIRKPVMLMILDGWGIAPPSDSNAISVANTPVFDKLVTEYPNTQIAAHGNSVGLPKGQMGNSEVGHLNLGAGRVVKQDLMRINEAIETDTFRTNQNLVAAADAVKKAGGRMHLIGLCSPGGVHSALPHMYAAVDMFAKAELDVFIHALTDGRDTPPSSVRGYMKDIEAEIQGKARVSTVIGRFWAMDRDKRWDRVERGYNAMVLGEGTPHKSADEAIAAAYEAGQTDEFIEPRIVVDDAGTPIGNIKDGDGVLFFNFRADRAREITMALAFEKFDGFERKAVRNLSHYVCMTEFQADFGLPMAFPPLSMDNILGKVLEDRDLTQFRCAETEKYAHVTFFFNGGEETPFANEDRVLIPSPQDVATYDQKPAMSAFEVTDEVVSRIRQKTYDLIILNFANPDMVGHTGVLEAAIAAMETVDECTGRVVDALLEVGGCALITADHGNCETMTDETGAPQTAHTANRVPLILVDPTHLEAELRPGILADLAPTILSLMELAVPPEMTGKSLIS
jgi:2,3-bisphosphoglycerate-independent phosphoglycerate mutase